MARQGALREEPLYLSDDAAGQAAVGIARRLRGKVVRVAVQDHGPPDVYKRQMYIVLLPARR